jgi:hypothetical protein
MIPFRKLGNYSRSLLGFAGTSKQECEVYQLQEWNEFDAEEILSQAEIEEIQQAFRQARQITQLGSPMLASGSPAEVKSLELVGVASEEGLVYPSKSQSLTRESFLPDVCNPIEDIEVVAVPVVDLAELEEAKTALEKPVNAITAVAEPNYRIHEAGSLTYFQYYFDNDAANSNGVAGSSPDDVAKQGESDTLPCAVDGDVLANQVEEANYAIHETGPLTYFQYYFDDTDRPKQGQVQNTYPTFRRPSVSSGLIGAGVLGATLISGFIVADTIKKPTLDPAKNSGPKPQDKRRQVGEAQATHGALPQPTAPEALQPELSALPPLPQAKLVPRLASLPKLPAIIGSQAVPVVVQTVASLPALANPSLTYLSSPTDNSAALQPLPVSAPDNLPSNTESSSSSAAEGSENAITPFEQLTIAEDGAQSTIATDDAVPVPLGSTRDVTAPTKPTPAPSFSLPTPEQTVGNTTNEVSAQPALSKSPSPSSSLAEISLVPAAVNRSGSSMMSPSSTMGITLSEREEKAIADQQQVSAVSMNPPGLLGAESSLILGSGSSEIGVNSTADERQASTVSTNSPVLLAASQSMLTSSSQIPSTSALLQADDLKALLIAPQNGFDPTIPPLRSLTREEAQSFSQVDTLEQFTRRTLRPQDYVAAYRSISNQQQAFPPFGFIDYQHKLILLPDDSDAVVSLQLQSANQPMTQDVQLTSVISPDR